MLALHKTSTRRQQRVWKLLHRCYISSNLVDGVLSVGKCWCLLALTGAPIAMVFSSSLVGIMHFCMYHKNGCATCCNIESTSICNMQVSTNPLHNNEALGKLLFLQLLDLQIPAITHILLSVVCLLPAVTLGHAAHPCMQGLQV